MPYEDEEPPYVEPDHEVNELARSVVDASYEVYRGLGAGLDEAMYEAALCRELKLRGIPFDCQVFCEVVYKGEVIGKRRIDLIVGNRLVVEIKSVEALAPLHKAQLVTYLKITGLKLGLLINFNSAILKDGIKRVINSTGH